MNVLARPRNCIHCLNQQRLLRQWIKLRRAHHVRTWCLICGKPVALTVKRDYREAVEFFYGLDDQPMVHHAGNHEEPNGGWGIHWRLDEVLCAVFPELHIYEIENGGELWPMPPYYEHDKSEDRQVEVISYEEARVIAMNGESLRSLVGEELNHFPHSREELEQIEQRIWDEFQLEQDFTLLGFRRPFAMVRRKHDGICGTVLYQDSPRFYYGFEKDRII
jgi:hypothetical protein